MAWVSAVRPREAREGGVGVMVAVGEGVSVGVGAGVSVREGESVSVGEGAVVCPPSACGLRSAVCGPHAARKRLRVRSRMRVRGNRGMGTRL